MPFCYKDQIEPNQQSHFRILLILFFVPTKNRAFRESVQLGEKGVTVAETTSQSKFISPPANCITQAMRMKKM
jgi:hypothetical protein